MTWCMNAYWSCQNYSELSADLYANVGLTSLEKILFVRLFAGGWDFSDIFIAFESSNENAT